MTAKPFDFTSLDIFAKDVPHDRLAQLRRETPVYWNQVPNPATEQGFWLITKHKDIVQIEKNTNLFSSHYGLTLADAPPSTWGPPWSMIRDGLTHLDPPEHAAHRQLIAPLFAPKAIQAIEDRIHAVANAVLDRACELRNFDFATEVALRFPVAVVLGELFGLPSEDFPKIIHWSDVVVAPYDPEFARSAGLKAIHELYQYALSAKAMRMRKPTNDVLSTLAHTKTADGSYMSDEVFVRYFWSLVTGAFDTTASAISGGMLALISFPEEHEKLLADPSLVPLAVEEILRWETPTNYFRRTAMADTVIREQKILKGQRVLM
jgi:cytochrome P450